MKDYSNFVLLLIILFLLIISLLSFTHLYVFEQRTVEEYNKYNIAKQNEFYAKIRKNEKISKEIVELEQEMETFSKKVNSVSEVEKRVSQIITQEQEIMDSIMLDKEIFSWKHKFLYPVSLKDVPNHYSKKGIHSYILKSRLLFRKEVTKDYWEPIYVQFGGRTEENIKFFTELMMALSEVETGVGFSENNQNLAKQNTGQGWGILQIEDVGTPYRTSKVSNDHDSYVVKIRITRNSQDERLNPEKSIAFSSALMRNLIIAFDYDYFKAIQAYNYGYGGMRTIERVYGNDWFYHLHEIPRLLGKESHGDYLYFKKVLKILE